MENSPAEPSASYHRDRRAVFNPLSIAVAVVLLSAGGAFGWRVNTSAPSARPTPEVAAAALALERADRRTMCSGGGLDEVRDRVLQGPSRAGPSRLSEYLPKRSPLPGHGRPTSRALDPSTDTDYLSGAVEGHAASFHPEGTGAFDVYAYRFLTRRAAADAVAAGVVHSVCDLGAVPLTARGRAGMIVLEEDGPRRGSSAWWTNEADVIVVKYEGWGDPKASLANLAAIAGATALF